MSKAKNNKYLQEPQDTLDLHGFTVAEAEIEVEGFLAEAIAKNYRLVRIITGKGLSNASGVGVLKAWLTDYLRYKPYSWRFAKMNEGGEGAFDIKL